MLGFLIFQVFPLFVGAKVAPESALAVPAEAVAFGEDEYGEFPFVVRRDGRILFQRAKDGKMLLEWTPVLGDRRVTAVRSYPRTGLVFLGLSDGAVQEVRVVYRSTFDDAGKRTVEPVVTPLEPVAIGRAGLPCVDVWDAKGPQSRLLLVRQEEGGKPLLTAVRLTERKGLGGKGKVTVSAPFVVAADAASVDQVLLPSTAESLLVIGRSGEVRAYADDGAAFTFLQSFTPFKGATDPAVAAAGLIFGNVSVVLVDRAGAQQVWSMYPQLQPDGKSLRRAYLASPMEFSRMTSGFKMRLHPIHNTWRAHLGVDYGAPTGTPVRSVGDGVVEFAGSQNGFGNVVFINHGKGHTTVYAHLSRILVKKAQLWQILVNRALKYGVSFKNLNLIPLL
jgi:hypothetical protein